MKSLAILLGRVLLALIFILAGWDKFNDYEAIAAFMASKGITMIPFFLYSAAIVELLGGLALFIGFKARWAALILFLFLIPTTLLFHAFWHEDLPGKSMQTILFLKSLAIMGGLLYAMACGAGKLAIDTLFEGKH